MTDVKLEASWKEALKEEFNQDYMNSLRAFLKEELKAGKVLYPPNSLIFNALNKTPLDQVKVVILGQDPYHGPGQAHGLSFSVPTGQKPPPSLLNIGKELKADLGINLNDTNLEKWSQQGVLLLNSVLTVEQNKPASHAGKGWEVFTDKIMDVLNSRKKGLVYILWGKYAAKKGERLDNKNNLVLISPHPSPFSAFSGFFGSKPFSKTNDYLINHGISPILW